MFLIQQCYGVDHGGLMDKSTALSLIVNYLAWD